MEYNSDLPCTIKYSDKEKDLIDLFGYSEFIGRLEPPVIYNMMMEKAFLDDMQGPEVRSLRRVIKALRSCTPYRLTPEWDAMIWPREMP